jgi:hypothetical protein
MQPTKNEKENNEETKEKTNKETIFIKSNGTN